MHVITAGCVLVRENEEELPKEKILEVTAQAKAEVNQVQWG